MANRCPERMLEYYYATQEAYGNWGKDQDRPGLYALHSGFLPDGKKLSHYEELTEYNTRIIDFSSIECN